MTDLREAIARAIVEAGYNPATAPGIADAVIAILPDAKALAEAMKAMLDATSEHDVWCSLGPVRNCNCDLNPVKEQARTALANYRKGTGREG